MNPEHGVPIRRQVRYGVRPILYQRNSLNLPQTLISGYRFDGALKICWKPHPERDFAFEAIFELDHPAFAQFRSGKPPLHIHPHQEEYIQVLEGALALEVEGVEHVVRPEDGEFLVEPWKIHRLYTLPPPGAGDPPSTDSNTVRFYASGEKTAEMFNMDILFFENWYRYQDEIIRNKKSIDIIQAMSVGLA